MKILYLNLYEGCQEKTRFKKVIAFINKVSPDILGLSELNGWQKNKFQKLLFFKKQTFFKKHLFAKATSGYNLGLFSRYPLQKTLIVTKGFNTGLIKADIIFKNQPLEIFLTHLHHINEDARMKELKIILAKTKNNLQSLLMGDLNSLSKDDNYNNTKLLNQMSKAGISKFGKDKLRTDVTGTLLKNGWVDTLRERQSKFQYSVPTDFNKDPKHFTKLRLDYIFIKKVLAPNVKLASIIRSVETNKLSDHFPVELEIE